MDSNVAYKGYPNHKLNPDQYTDDSQLILIASRLLAKENWDPEIYAKELIHTYDLNKFRYPDGVTYAACKQMKMTNDFIDSCVYSDSAGCITLSVPFALAYKNRKEMAPNLFEVCGITHTHPEIFAATLSFALFLNTLLKTGNLNIAYQTLLIATKNMDPEIASCINNAMRIEEIDIPIDKAIVIIGNTISIYHTLPRAIFLCKRYNSPNEYLT
ncbi:MAG TPA: ADP-ribosylglycohydrolase family protein [Methanocorpusculum sp.]|nr:ADP-ribosylglycohydrolase family protein [Methanocorpusculum sp.]